jgi:Transposase, Mutator family
VKLLIVAGAPAALQLNKVTGKGSKLVKIRPVPRVIISDQVKGLIAALPIYLPTTAIQLCDWHVYQNIRKRLAEKKYTKSDGELINDRVWGGSKQELEVRLRLHGLNSSHSFNMARSTISKSTAS